MRNPIREWLERRKADRVDRELLDEIEVTEWFAGPMDPISGERPLRAGEITAAPVNASAITYCEDHGAFNCKCADTGESDG